MVAIDVACGFGRHCRELQSRSASVVGIDFDHAALRSIGTGTVAHGRTRDRDMMAVRAELEAGLPLKSASADLVVAIHYPMLDLIPEMARVLRPGGHLILETFSGKGDNWQALPFPGKMKAELGSAFKIIDYKESRVGPIGANAVSVKVLACKRSEER
jgi:SAM-dependent methyltransferase